MSVAKFEAGQRSAPEPPTALGLARALFDTGERFRTGLVGKATAKAHVRALWGQAEQLGLGRQVVEILVGVARG